jgi:hypothetical protein
VPKVSEGDGELGGEGARHDLSECHREAVLLLGHPAALLDQIAVHEARKRDGAAKTQAAEVQEIADERAKRRAGCRCNRCRSRRHVYLAFPVHGRRSTAPSAAAAITATGMEAFACHIYSSARTATKMKAVATPVTAVRNNATVVTAIRPITPAVTP